MKIGKLRIRRKALSPVIATLLMVAIAVAAAIITYVWSMGLLGGLMGTGGQQTKEQLVLEAYDWTGANLQIVLRNVGSGGVNIAAIYLEGNSWINFGTTGTSIPIGGTYSASSTPPSGPTFTLNVAYVLKIVTTSGGTFTYSVVRGKAG